MRNRLIILSGLPGSGKSTFAKEYAEKAKKEGYEVRIVSSDEIRKNKLGNYGDLSQEKYVWTEFHNQIVEYSKLDKTIVLLDATFLTNKKRYNYALRYKKLYKQIQLMVFITDWEQCLENNCNREKEKWVPYNVMNDMRKTFDKIDRYTCFSYFNSVEYRKMGDPIRIGLV